MKKMITMAIAVLITSSVFAQPMEVQSAFASHKNGYLDKAKRSIDKATTHELTKSDAKAWTYKALIYLAIHQSTNPKYKVLDSGALDIAYDALLKASEYDKATHEQADKIMSLSNMLSGEYFNIGVSQYNEKQLAKAVESFDKTAQSRANINVFDSIYTKALYYGALSADQDSTLKSKSISNLKKLYDIKYKLPWVYESLSNYCMVSKDTAKALTIIQEGRKICDDNITLIVAEANIYLKQKKSKEAQDILRLAIEKDPKNALLHLAIAQKYEEVGNYAEAEKEYSKTLEIKPDYFDAIYSFGIMYFNQGADINNAMNIKIDKDFNYMNTKEYADEKTKSDELFNKSIPYLEKCIAMKPDDKDTLMALRNYYKITKNTPKLQEINAKIKALK